MLRSTRVPRYITTILAITFSIFFSAGIKAQSPSPSNDSAADAPSRIERARALIAAHHLETAASELESVRGGTQDQVLRNVTSVMLMSIYLEAGNYARAEALLEESFRARAPQSADSLRTYFALTGQAVNGARAHIARYRSFGISTTDSNLPAEAINDLDRLRSFLERVIAQAKEISAEHRAYDSLSLLEDVLGIRLALARDMEDQVKWQSQYAGARELLASQTQIASLRDISALPPSKTSIKNSSPSPYSTRREKTEAVPEKQQSSESINNDAGDHTSQSTKGPISDTIATEASSAANEPAITEAGSLNSKATKKVIPVYPTLAKLNRTTGLVRVHVVVDENGKVVEVSRTEGPILLRRVSEDAARQWFFEAPSSGRLSGYIDFTFTL
ncbi:MAG: energy transducer TonB [Acidobacteriota bacterium]|nr:energy transducer TonB [Acidobacteriota bacterium]